MPALSGSQKAPVQARAAIARAGATRAGYFLPNIVVTINSVARTTSVMEESVHLSLALNDEPDTASFTMKPGSTVPVVGHSVLIGLGTSVNRVFGGSVLRVKHRRIEGLFDTPYLDVECIDWSRLFNRERVTRTYQNTSATAIALDIISQDTTGFTGDGIQAGLPTIDEFVILDEEPLSVLRRLVTRIGGGGVYIRADRDVRLFDSGGDLTNDAATNPVTLTNTLTTLKAFSHTYDGAQLRTRAIVNGRSTNVVLRIPAGTSLATATGVPLSNSGGWIFNGSAGTNYALLGSTEVTYLLAIQVTGPPACVTSAIANPGDTSVSVVSNAAFAAVSATGFCHDGRDNYFAFRAVGGTPTLLDNIPASGYGSIPVALASGTPLYMAHMLAVVVAQTASGTVETDIEVGDTIRVRVGADDIAEMTAVSVIEGEGDGVHEHVVNAPEAVYAGAVEIAQAELDAFAASTGLLNAEWVTTDMNAQPGAQQVINFTGTDALSATLTITNTELTFPVKHTPPFRRCVAGDVKSTDVLDALTDLVSRTPQT